MIAAENQTFNDIAGAELISLGDFVQRTDKEIDKAWGFFVYQNKNWVVKVEILPTIDAFAPTIDA